MADVLTKQRTLQLGKLSKRNNPPKTAGKTAIRHTSILLAAEPSRSGS